jgi:hypothetical protein
MRLADRPHDCHDFLWQADNFVTNTLLLSNQKLMTSASDRASVDIVSYSTRNPWRHHGTVDLILESRGRKNARGYTRSSLY